MDRNELNILSNKIIGATIEVHKILGPGLLENTYQDALIWELERMGVKAEKEVDIPFRYKDKIIEKAYRADIIVENEIILELKSTEKDNPVYYKQLLTYLRLANKRLGFLINFHHNRIIDGIKRMVNNF